MTVLVTGATGTIGRHLVRDLAAAGFPVRAAVREPGRAGVLGELAATAVTVDLDDPAAVDTAAAGADQVVLITANTERQLQQEINVIEAARRHGAAHLIKVSVGGVGPEAPLALARDHFAAEERLRESGVPATIVRPGFMMENLLQYADWIEPDGTWRLPFGDGAVALIDGRDIAAGIAALLSRVAPDGGDQVWTGAEALTLTDIAKQLSQATGRSITYADGDGDSFYAHYVADGQEPRYARDITTLYDRIVRAGWAGATTGGLEALLGRPPRTFAEFARENAAAFSA